MPYDPRTNSFTRDLRYVDDRLIGDDVTRADLDAALDDIETGINTALGLAQNFIGEWSAASGVFPASRPDGSPVRVRDTWVVSAAGNTGGVQFEAGEALVALRNAPGASYPMNWLKVVSITPVAAGQILQQAQTASESAIEAAEDAQQAAAAAQASLTEINAKITVSPNAPSGGSDGDLWFQYV